LQTKLSPANEDVEISGVRVPAGTQISLSQHALMRRTDVFGPDAMIFRPERWISEKDGETLKRMEKVWELSFAAGRFTCLGRGIALMEVNKVFVEVRTFFFSSSGQ
jgi:cytochrome P450